MKVENYRAHVPSGAVGAVHLAAEVVSHDEEHVDVVSQADKVIAAAVDAGGRPGHVHTQLRNEAL